jgi:hypothetical protein
VNLFGKYVGFVRDTADPENRGRLRCYVPEVMGELDDTDHWTGWALPCLPWIAYRGVGSALVPVVTAGWGVWLEFRQGDPRFPIWVGVFPLQSLTTTVLRFDAAKVELGGENPATGEGVVLASYQDPMTGVTAGAAGGASTRVFAKKT